jgi:hypothetical protein
MNSTLPSVAELMKVERHVRVRHAISAFNVFHRYRLRVTRASFVPSGVAARPDPSGDGAR